MIDYKVVTKVVMIRLKGLPQGTHDIFPFFQIDDFRGTNRSSDLETGNFRFIFKLTLKLKKIRLMYRYFVRSTFSCQAEPDGMNRVPHHN